MTAIEFSFNGCRIGVQGLKVEVEVELEPLLQAAMFKALLTIRGIQFAPDGGYKCTFPALDR